MILTKLQEALAEVDSQRAALNEVESQLRSMIAKLSGMPVMVNRPAPPVVPVPRPVSLPNADRDTVDEIADILRAEGKPLHITVIAERLSALKNENVVRTGIEPGLNRHVAKTKRKRIVKVAPSTFALPEWNSDRSLSETA
jgi:hypothetical protein